MIVKTHTAGPAQSNCYVVMCEDTRKAALIDPGWDADRILASIDELRAQVEIILLTHAHFDHFAALPDVLDVLKVPVAMHPLDLPLLRDGGGARFFGISIRPCAAPEIELQHGQLIEVGALRFEIRFTPGHSPGHVVFYLADEKAVFDGDVLFSGGIGRTDLPGGDFDTLINSIRTHLLTLPDDVVVYSGHGPTTTIANERLFNPFL
jgi:glyoxylase-like metal-dependent hydrolase (beta-lactamase superfamily II)